MTNEQKLRALISEGKAEMLTVKKSIEIRGRKVACLYFGYASQDKYMEFNVGNYRTLWDIAEQTPLEGWKNQAEYWKSYMSDGQIADKINTVNLFTADEVDTYYRAHECNKGVFTCSDIDRPVYFMLIDEN